MACARELNNKKYSCYVSKKKIHSFFNSFVLTPKKSDNANYEKVLFILD